MLPSLSPELAFPLGLLALFVMSFFAVNPVPIPFPLTITILWLARFDLPVPVILTATLGTLLGWVWQEEMFKRLISRPKLQKAIPVSYQRFFMRRTGFWMFFFNALPFPWDPMRLLALLSNYPRRRFLLVLGVSRLIRNTLLVMAGALVAAHKTLFWAVLIGFLVLPVLLDRALKYAFARIRPEELSLPGEREAASTPAEKGQEQQSAGELQDTFK